MARAPLSALQPPDDEAQNKRVKCAGPTVPVYLPSAGGIKLDYIMVQHE